MMKVVKIIFKTLLIFVVSFLLIFNLYIIVSGKLFIYKALRYNFVGIDDYKLFDYSTIQKSDAIQYWNYSSQLNKLKLPEHFAKLDSAHGTFSFLVIKNDSIIYEKYAENYSDTLKTNSFSMAKSVISMLIGVAIKEGKIKSIDEPVFNYLPEFKEGEKSKIKIKDLLMMSSGLNWNESKSYKNLIAVFFSDIMEAYYGNDLYKLCMKTQLVSTPGVYFDYKSGDTQLLAFILQKATGVNVSKYFQEKIWKPIGANQDALWSLDQQNGNEKAFCCISSNAKDFSKLGKLILNKGKWNNSQIIDSAYLADALSPKNLITPDAEKVDYYGYQFWLLPQFKDENIIYMRGTLGQIIIVIPQKNVIITRLGTSEGPKVGDHYGLAIEYAKYGRSL